MGPASDQTAHLLVSDLLNADLSWDLDRIQLLLPEYESSIRCIKPSVTGAPDRFIWLGTKTGDYTVKSGYFFAASEETEQDEQHANFNWKKNVWELDCAPKVKHFAWKILKRALPVGERLMERHIDADPKCKRCGSNESITHLLFDCRFAQQVWQFAPFTTVLDYRGIVDLMASWPALCSQRCLPPAGIISSSLFPWILWTIWKARNRLVFEGVLATPEEALTSAIKLAREWTINSKPDSTAPKNRAIPTPRCDAGTLTVRSDAAWNSNSNVAGIGWVILSSPNHQEFHDRLEWVPSPLLAEGLALREAVHSCLRSGATTVRGESDSAQLIRCLNSGEVVPELHSVVSDILCFASYFHSCSFVWIPRENNSIADGLAKMALNFVDIMVEDAFIAPN
ncbi:hypothetical protein Bca4012_096527 [Brassica carinata]